MRGYFIYIAKSFLKPAFLVFIVFEFFFEKLCYQIFGEKVKNRKIKILFYTETSKIGGVFKVIEQIIKQIDKKKFTITLMAPHVGELDNFIEKLGIRTVQFKPIKGFNLKELYNLGSLIRNEEPDIIHFHLDSVYACEYGIYAAILSHIKILVGTEHARNNPSSSLINRVIKILSSLFLSQVIAVSESLKDSLINQHRLNPKKVKTIRNAVDIQLFKPENMPSEEIYRAKQKFGIGKDKFVIGTVAQLHKNKGHIYLLKALKMIQDDNVIAVLWGNGPLEHELNRIIEQYSLTRRVKFVGFASEIVSAYTIMDVFVLPSLLEGLPLSLLEAMAMEKAVIATYVDGNKEVISNYTDGILIPPRNPGALADAIAFFLKNREKVLQFGRKAREKIKSNYHIDEMVRKYEGLYTDLYFRNEEIQAT